MEDEAYLDDPEALKVQLETKFLAQEVICTLEHFSALNLKNRSQDQASA